MTCARNSFATTNTFKSPLHYLLSNGYITRIARGIYQITPKGKKYLVLLASWRTWPIGIGAIAVFASILIFKRKKKKRELFRKEQFHRDDKSTNRG
jgi:DNA-binding PadR family transcriptional regulator